MPESGKRGEIEGYSGPESAKSHVSGRYCASSSLSSGVNFEDGILLFARVRARARDGKKKTECLPLEARDYLGDYPRVEAFLLRKSRMCSTGGQHGHSKVGTSGGTTLRNMPSSRGYYRGLPCRYPIVTYSSQQDGNDRRENCRRTVTGRRTRGRTEASHPQVSPVLSLTVLPLPRRSRCDGDTEYGGVLGVPRSGEWGKERETVSTPYPPGWYVQGALPPPTIPQGAVCASLYTVAWWAVVRASLYTLWHGGQVVRASLCTRVQGRRHSTRLVVNTVTRRRHSTRLVTTVTREEA